MKLSSQCFQAEKEYKEVYIHFKTACCLDWNKEDEIIKAYKRALIILNHLKSIYPSLYKVYKNYEIKIILLYFFVFRKGKNMEGIVIEKKMVSAEEISKFYAITKKTAQNRISEMKNNPIFMTGDFFRMNGRVWFPAFDEFIKQRDELKYK